MKDLDQKASVLDIRKRCTNKTVVIIGDVHGCFDELLMVLDKIGWNQKTHIIIFTGDLIDRGPKIKDALLFAMTTPNVYTLMSNHEYTLLRFLRGNQITIGSLSKTIVQCGELIFDTTLSDWLESLPYIIRWTDSSFVVHAGIVPFYPIYNQKKTTCIYIRTWNPSTNRMSVEGDEPWYKFDPVERIKIYFGHNVHSYPFVSNWTVAMDGGVVFGDTLRACLDGKEIIEVQSKAKYYWR